MSDWDDMVLVGVIARTHGNRGQVILNAETDFAEERFQIGRTVYARIGSGPVEPLQITAVRFQQGRPIIGVAGIGSIDEAERLAGALLKVPADEQGPLPVGTFYHHQLIGCDVATKDGEEIGRVTAVEGNGMASRLVVRGRRADVLIPLASEICDIDIQEKRIVVTPPAGLLEVNGDWR